MKKNHSPDFKRVILSYEKVENVVNPPQIPVIRNNLVSGLKIFPFSARPTKAPIRKQPIRLTEKVPSGNWNGYNLDTSNCMP